MIFNFLISVVVLFIGAVTQWLPIVTTIPSIGGFDLDGALVTGISAFSRFTLYFWPIRILFIAFLWVMGYYAIKKIVILFMGKRAD